MKKILILLLAVSFAACNTEKRAARRMSYLAVGHPTVAATFCASTYPARVENKTTIEYKEGKRDTLWQAEYVDCDTVIGETRIVKVPYPVQINTKDTLVYRDSIFTENTAKVDQLTRQNSLAEAEAKHYKKRARRNAVLGFFAGFITYFVTSILIKR
jgi:hypothetical protein